MAKTDKATRCTCDDPEWSGAYYVEEGNRHRHAICSKCSKPVGMRRSIDLMMGAYGSNSRNPANIAMTDALVAQYAYLDGEEDFTLSKEEMQIRAERIASGAKEAMLRTGDRQLAVANMFYRAMQAIEEQLRAEREGGTLSEETEDRYMNMIAVAGREYNKHSAAAVRTLKAADSMHVKSPEDEWDAMMKGKTVDATYTESPDSDE